LNELKGRLAEVADLERVSILLAWDQEVAMPPRGAESRAEMRASIERLGHERFTDDRVGELLACAAPESEVDDDLLAVTRRDYDKARRVPGELVAEMVHASAIGHEAWARAREESDFALFEPFLRRNIELRRRYIACHPEAARPYDALLDDHEPQMRTGEAEAVLERLRDGLIPLVEAAVPVDTSLVQGGTFAVDAQRRLVETVLRQVGADDERWRLDVAVHPFAAIVAPGDVRLTTRYAPDDLDSLYSAVHESQSRLWENMVGRSAGFWRWCFPHVQEAFPSRFAGRTWEDVHRAVNVVAPSLIRVTADEVTYGLHVILRFELELALFEGGLDPSSLPEAWNERMRSYLGVEVPHDAHGVLQDVHWAEGLFGYFPTYALGTVISGQLWARILGDLPEIDELLARGDFAPLRDWLAEHVHRHGRRLTPAELIVRATGGPLDAEPYLQYVRAKVAASASLIG
jgi:carboxypeptidase Taq